VADEALEVVLRLQRLVVARQADHADLGVGHHVEHAVQHAQAGAQDGHDGDLAAGDLLDLDRAAPALDGGLLEREVGRGLVGQQAAQFVGQLAELLGGDVLVSRSRPILWRTSGWVTAMTGMVSARRWPPEV
jgi:hypothetical protein